MNWLLERWLDLVDSRLAILDMLLGTAGITSVLWVPYLISKWPVSGWWTVVTLWVWATLVAASLVVSHTRGVQAGMQIGLKAGSNTAMEVMDMIASDPLNQDLTVAELARRSKVYVEQSQAR